MLYRKVKYVRGVRNLKALTSFLKRRERGNFQAYCIPCQAAYRREKYSKEQNKIRI